MEGGDKSDVRETALEQNGNNTKVVVPIELFEKINCTEPFSAETESVQDRSAGQAGKRGMKSQDEHVLDIPHAR